jgi:hypothetical protein
MIRIRSFLASILALAVLLPLSAGTRSSSSTYTTSRPSSYGSFSRSSSPSVSKPSGYGTFGASKPAASPSGYGKFGSSKPTQPSTGYGAFGGGRSTQASPSVKSSPSQAAWARSQQADSAARDAKQALAKFRTPAPPAPARDKIAASPVFGRYVASPGAIGTRPQVQHVTYQTYIIQRQSYYSNWHTPAYVYGYSPSYGMWDAMFMWYLLDRLDSDTYYNHRQDADWQRWRVDADRQAQSDAAVRAKLDQMDAKINAMQAQGVKVDPAYVPAGVDPSVAMAPSVAEASLEREPTPPQPQPEPQAQPGGGIGKMGVVMLAVLGSLVGLGLLAWWFSPERSSSASITGRYRP